MSNDYNGKKRSELPDSVFGIPQENILDLQLSYLIM